MNKKAIELTDLFKGLQEDMICRLTINRKIPHSGAKGNATELRWLDFFSCYFPKRYNFSKGFVIDSNGNLSDEIDIIVYDRQYSPFFFNKDGILYIPAESVYAVFEVKQKIDKEYITYTGNKIESVRKLHRTSAPIAHAGGTYAPKPLAHIIGGILALDSGWDKLFDKELIDALNSLNARQEIDIGLALNSGSFIVNYYPTIQIKPNKKDPLLFFMLHLFIKLQEVATVPAIEIQKYFKEL